MHACRARRGGVGVPAAGGRRAAARRARARGATRAGPAGHLLSAGDDGGEVARRRFWRATCMAREGSSMGLHRRRIRSVAAAPVLGGAGRHH